MAGTEFELYIRTPIDPQQIIMEMREYLEVSAPIEIFLWRTVSEVIMYYCDFPMERLGEHEAAWIRVTAYHLPPFWQKRVSECFDSLGMTEQPQTDVGVEFTLSTFDIDYEDGRLEILRLMGPILGLTDGDCFAGTGDCRYCEQVRKNGEVMIDTSEMRWSEEQKQVLGFPLTIAKIPHLPP